MILKLVCRLIGHVPLPSAFRYGYDCKRCMSFFDIRANKWRAP